MRLHIALFSNRRCLQAMRELDRERVKMEQNEKKIIADIKKMAKAGQMVCDDIEIGQSSLCRRYYN